MTRTPNPAESRCTFARRLRETGLDTRRFIDVLDGEKGSRDHTQREPTSRHLLGNYGVYGGPGDGEGGDGELVDIDVDDYRDDVNSDALREVDRLPATFTVESPHTSDDEPGHRYYRVVPGEKYDSAVDAANAATGTSNPDLSWGEVRVKNQYVVGPGSQLDRCDKDWCDDCATPDGGYYRIAEDRAIATITADDLFDLLDADSETSQPPRPRSGDEDGGQGTSEVDSGRGWRKATPDVRTDSPTRLPECYDGALDARVDVPEDAPHAHAVNRVAAILAIYHGYDAETAMEHFRDAPLRGDPTEFDAETTLSALRGTSEKVEAGDLHPPGVEKLRRLGILDGGETCSCPLHSHTADGADDRGGRHRVVECEPPVRDLEPFDIESRRRELREERFDGFLDHEGVDIWGDDPGLGKTTNGALGALTRGQSCRLYFDRHEKAREFVTDDVIQNTDGDTDFFHLKGGAQKRFGRCMDADHADEDCPEHGHVSDCPSMCPIYDLEPNHEVRGAYEALVRELGPNRAHHVLGLCEQDEYEWHGTQCAWQAQYESIENEPRVVGVHQYLTQKTVRATGLNLIDETPDLLSCSRRVSVTKLVRIANSLDRIADLRARDDPLATTARGFASFIRSIVDTLTDATNEDALEDLDPPEVTWNAYEAYDDAAGNYVEIEPPEEDWQLAEILAKLKVEHGEIILERMRNDGWEGTPISIDPVLVAAVEAGLSRPPVMQAVAVSSVIDSCPWCGSECLHDNGARCCSADECGWNEIEQTLIQRGAEQARAGVWAAPDGESALDYRELPLPSDLPDPESTLVMDATATPDKIATLFDIAQDDVRVSGSGPVEMPNLHTTQVLDGQYHAGTIERALEEDATLASRIQRVIGTAADVHEKPLYVMKKDLISEFDFPDGGEVLHYHATRGLNRNDCDAVVCIGAPHPHVDDLRRHAELLAMGREDVKVGGIEHSTRRNAENPPIYRKLYYEDDEGRGRAVPTKHFTGLVGTLFREAREKELVQALHRIRPLLGEEPKHAYLLTNIPTTVPVDEVATFKELSDPLRAMVPVPDGAVDLLNAVHDVVEGDVAGGFRADSLVEVREDAVANKVKGYHRLARCSGLDVCLRTVYTWVDELEAIGLLRPEEYEQRAGVSYAVETATLKDVLSVLSSNVGFEVAAVRRFRRIIDEADTVTDWLEWARETFVLTGDRCDLPIDGEPPGMNPR